MRPDRGARPACATIDGVGLSERGGADEGAVGRGPRGARRDGGWCASLREGMAVDVALDGREALSRATVNRYDVIVLDRDLPGVHGDEVCHTLVSDGCEARVFEFSPRRGQSRIGWTASASEPTSYLPKPFAFAELVGFATASTRPSFGNPPTPDAGPR